MLFGLVIIGLAASMSIQSVIIIVVIAVPVLVLLKIVDNFSKARTLHPAYNHAIAIIAILTLVVVLGTALWFLPSYISGVLGERPGEAYQQQIVPTRAEQGLSALTRTALVNASPEEKVRIGMDKWKEWVRDGTKPKSNLEQTVVLTSSEFSTSYKDVSAFITISDSIRLEEGVAFLVSDGKNGYRPIYRQMPLRIDITSESQNNDLHLIGPNAGEYLLVIVRVRSKTQDALPTNPESFGLQVKVK